MAINKTCNTYNDNNIMINGVFSIGQSWASPNSIIYYKLLRNNNIRK